MKKDPKMILCLFFCFYFKCSETSSDSVGHFGSNSLALTPSLPPSRSLLLSLKEAAFCDLQIEAGHVTPGGPSITRRGRPTSRLKGTAAPPAPPPAAPRQRALRSARTGNAQKAQNGWAARTGRATRPQLFSLKLAKEREAAGCAPSTPRQQSPSTADNETCKSPQPHALFCGAPPDAWPWRSPGEESPS